MENILQLAHSSSGYNLFVVSAVSLFIFMSIAALISIKRKRADIADVAWGGGFVLIGWISFILAAYSSYALLVNLMITVWGVRLSVHIFNKQSRSGEDYRYVNLKKNWNTWLNTRIYVQIFLFQGLLIYIIALPLMWINLYGTLASWEMFSLGAIIWCIGFFLEAISDYQLMQFQKTTSGNRQLLMTGLWSYVRHPNYLGELIQWWAIWILACYLPHGYWLIVSPLLLSFLILKVSGIPMLEKKLKQYEGFENYSKTTPMILPLTTINGLLYALSWYGAVYFGAKDETALNFVNIAFFTIAQIWIVFSKDRTSLLTFFPLAVYATVLGVILESVLLHYNVVKYSGQGHFSPFWLLSLYPLFSFTLNSSLSFLNKNLLFTFILGAIGAIFSYLAGERLGAVVIDKPLAYSVIFVAWGTYLTLLILLNRRLLDLKNLYDNPEKNSKNLVAFFDAKCSMCSYEMEKLKQHKLTGSIEFACPLSQEDMNQFNSNFSYAEAMESIHAVEETGSILKGTKALSAIYARTNCTFLAILLQAPGFRLFFRLCYSLWARLRMIGRK